MRATPRTRVAAILGALAFYAGTAAAQQPHDTGRAGSGESACRGSAR